MTALLIVDCETTGLDPEKDRLIEVGAVLFDAVRGIPVAAQSILIEGEGNAASDINRIPGDALRPWGWHPDLVAAVLARHVDHALEVYPDAAFAVAHNAAFDRQWLPALAKRVPWICTHADAEWPRLARNGLPPAGAGSLHALALAYDVGLVRAHRAIEDCLTIAAVLTRVHELEGGLGDWIARATEEKVEIVAGVSYDDRQLAKDAGFRWEPTRRLWTRRVRRSQVDALRDALPFATRSA